MRLITRRLPITRDEALETIDYINRGGIKKLIEYLRSEDGKLYKDKMYDEVGETFKEAIKATEEFAKLLKELRDKTRIFRILIWFDNLWFEIKNLPNLPKRIKHWAKYGKGYWGI